MPHDGRVLYFPLNDGRGQVAYDFAGRQLDGVLGSSSIPDPADPVWITAGRVGGALQFDGVSSCVIVPNDAALEFGAGVTLMVWLKRSAALDPNATADTMVLSKHFTNNDRAWHIQLDKTSAQFGFGVYDSADGSHVLQSLPNLTATMDQWFHVAGTYDGGSGEQALYVDGVQVAAANVGIFQLMQTTVPTRIGCLNNSNDGTLSRGFFPGAIDEPMVFNRALDASIIQAYYNGAP